MAAGGDPVAAFRVLGSIAISVDGRPARLGGEKPRRLLAMLVLHRNTVVSTDRLIEAIWGDEVPDRALPTLQSYASRLRRLLPASARLLGEPPGYRLEVAPDGTDVDCFEAGLEAALAQLDEAPAAALARLDEALGAWRGEAFAEFADEWWAVAEVARLNELRLHARESRVAALLALGFDERASSEAEALTVSHPWRERPWRARVLALHRAGRQGDALRTAHEYRARLREDLGLDPSPEFVDLERAVAIGAGGIAAVGADAVAPMGGDGAVVWSEPGPGADGLMGRDVDLTAVMGLCERRPLVTLLGPGGIGKTQLALHAAAALAATGQRAEVVELARVRDAPNVVPAVATQLDVQTQQGRSMTESVLDLLGERPLLLVLDNCEHVLDPIAAFVEQLGRTCPRVRVLATSREPLALPQETIYKVPALPVADDPAAAGPDASPAVELFLRRAQAANPDFVVDAAATAEVAELCRRLDGVPLAIELAAARSRSLSPTEIIERLGDRFSLLAGSSRVADVRHRSLRELVDWSYQLLDPGEQELFRRLSAFAGTFDLAAVERVCGYGQVAPEQVASVMGTLVDKSMVQALAGSRTTYRLLETLREYGSALAADERPQLARRHRAWVAEVCEQAGAGLGGADERRWSLLLEGLFDDLRLAVRTALDAGDLSTALRIVVGAREHAFRRLRYELIGWTERILASEGTTDEPLAAAAWGIVAYGRFVRGEVDAAIDLAERATALAAANKTDTLGLADRSLANAWVFRKDQPRSQEAIRRLVHSAEVSGDDARVAHACYMASLAQTSNAGVDAGLAYAERALAAALRCGSPSALAQASYSLGLWLAGAEPERAAEELQRSEALALDVGNLWFELFARTETLWLRAEAGDPLGALAGFPDVIAAWHRAGDWANQWLSLRHVLGICDLLGADELAATIYGALARAGAVDAFPFEPAAAARHAAMVDELRGRLGASRFAEIERQSRAAPTSVVIDRIVAAIRALTGAG